MADMDAEMEFLKSMRELNEAAGDYGADNVEAVQKEPLSTEDNIHLQDMKDSSFTVPADVSGNVAQVHSPSLTSSSEIVHPHSMSHPTSATLSNTAASRDVLTDENKTQEPPQLLAAVSSEKPSSSTKPRVLGGFIVDDDDEDEAPVQGSATEPLNRPSSSVGGGLSSDPQRSSSKSPVNTMASPQDVSVSNVTLENAPTLPQTSVPNVSNPLSSVVPDSAELEVGERRKSQDALAHLSTATAGVPSSTTSLPKARLPHDRVGILEDRIKEDPRGDIDAWLNLINEHQRRNKLEDARAAYERFFKIFPTAAEQWVTYANMELANNDFYRVEQIFTKSLRALPNLQLWSLYLDYVRRRNNLTADSAGTARAIVSQAYDFVLDNVGIDKESGKIWQDYIHFIRSGPGMIGGSSWQDQQKMDSLRKAYQRAICIPTSAVNALWKEYDAFEMGLNKTTGRKFLHEKSPAYMTARSSNIGLENIIRDLDRTTLPIMPPALGFDGDEDYLGQVGIWSRWIQWEKDDPLVLKDEDPAAYKARIVFTYKQAVMALRFWPEMWFAATEFCFENDLEQTGAEFLTQGMAANPESCLLAFAQADRLEYTLPPEEGVDGLRRRGETIREPYDKVLDALYDLVAKAKAREAQNVARIEETAAQGQLPVHGHGATEEEYEDEKDNEKDAQEAAKQRQVKLVKDGSAAEVQTLSKTISSAWIALMRAMRRVQGKGKVGDPVGGCRQVLTDARRRGRLTSDVYVASALIEYQCYKDSAATRIFERGIRLFPDDEGFALEYLKHLTDINDVTNARAVFETTVSKLTQKPETVHKAKPIFRFFHQYESRYGELSQIRKLEKRMSDLYPDDAQLSRFASRFAAPDFDPTAVRPIVSPSTQARPKVTVATDNPSLAQNTPPSRFVPTVSSPKRPLQPDESDTEVNRPRKLARGESPLKGAAGRRLDQQKRNQHHGQNQGSTSAQVSHGPWPAQQPPPPPPLPRDVLFLLSIIPRAETYNAHHFKPEGMVRLLRETNLPKHPQPQPRPMPMGFVQSQPNGPYRYVR